MRMVFGLVLLVGIALAGGAVYLAKDRIAQYQAANARAQAALAEVVPTEQCLSPRITLKYGQELKPDDVREVDMARKRDPRRQPSMNRRELFPEKHR